MFDSLLFLYFFTLHADQLNIPIAGFSIRLNNLIALIVLTLFSFRNRQKLFSIDRALFISLLILTASITISFLLSPYKQRCFFFLCWYGFTVVMYFLLPYLLIRYYDHKKVMSLYLLSFLCVGIYALLQLLFSFAGLKDPFVKQFITGTIARPNAFAYEPSFYALYMTPFIVMLNYHFLADRESPFYFFGKLTYPKILSINFLYFISTSTSALFAFAVFCFSLIFFSQVRRHLLKFCIAFTCLFFLIGILSPYLMKIFFLKFFYSGLGHGSFYERWAGIQNAWKVFQSHPYFGIGLGGYPPYLYDAFQTGDNRFAIIPSPMILSSAKNTMKLFEPSNVFTEIMSSLGIIGGLGFIGILFVFLARAKQAIKNHRTSGCGLLLSVAIMLIVLQINQGVFRTYIWTHMAITFALLEAIAYEASLLPTQDFSQAEITPKLASEHQEQSTYS